MRREILSKITVNVCFQNQSLLFSRIISKIMRLEINIKKYILVIYIDVNIRKKLYIFYCYYF